jgi:hypothetical protein
MTQTFVVASRRVPVVSTEDLIADKMDLLKCGCLLYLELTSRVDEEGASRKLGMVARKVQ